LPSILLAGLFAAIHLAALPLSEVLPIPGFNGEGAHTPVTIVLPCLLLVLYGIRSLLPRAAAAEVHFPIPDDDDDDRDFHF